METTLNALSASMKSFSIEFTVMREKKRGWKAAAARARKESLNMEKLLKQFRAASVQAEKE